MQVRAAVITVSDRAFTGAREDRSGPAMVEVLAQAGCSSVATRVVPDEIPHIRAAVTEAVQAGANLVLLTGGTGIAPRDVTGDALADLLDARLPGIEAELIRQGIAAEAPGALLSRPVAGIVRAAAALCIAGPGSVGGARDTASLAVRIAEHALTQLRGNTNAGHPPANDSTDPASTTTTPATGSTE